MDYAAAAWQPWISENNIDTLERSNQKALRMVTGQSLGTPTEAIRAEAGVVDYATIRKRHILTAREKALRARKTTQPTLQSAKPTSSSD